jgi:hypothetical protein
LYVNRSLLAARWLAQAAPSIKISPVFIDFLALHTVSRAALMGQKSQERLQNQWENGIWRWSRRAPLMGQLINASHRNGGAMVRSGRANI